MYKNNTDRPLSHTHTHSHTQTLTHRHTKRKTYWLKFNLLLLTSRTTMKQIHRTQTTDHPSHMMSLILRKLSIISISKQLISTCIKFYKMIINFNTKKDKTTNQQSHLKLHVNRRSKTKPDRTCSPLLFFVQGKITLKTIFWLNKPNNLSGKNKSH